MVATIGITAAARTADSHAPLPVISRTPNERATGEMRLPAVETERPMKNHRNAGERSGRSAAGRRSRPLSPPGAGAQHRDPTAFRLAARGFTVPVHKGGINRIRVRVHRPRIGEWDRRSL
jgi:hypothetical protein